MSKFIPILRVGRYKDASGRNYDITPRVLKELQETYTSKSAPLVKGHPTNDAPSMGWIDKLKIHGEELLASFSDVTEAFKQEVEQRSFKNISASFFMPLSESNPNKGKYCLRHVGALGASRPAIPNLGTLQEALEDRMSEVQNGTRMSPAFCTQSEDELTCYVEFAEQEENIGFVEKLIKGAIEKALKKQREEIMAEVKRSFQSLSFADTEVSTQNGTGMYQSFCEPINQENKEAGIQLSPSLATLDSDILSSGGINMAEKTARELELEQENQKQKEEIDRLKSEQDKSERSKVIADEVSKVKEEKNLDDETTKKLIEKAEASAETDGKKAVADFAEFLEPQKKTTNHRFGNRSADSGKGSADFSEDSEPIENTALFADEVAKLEKQGLPRADAFRQAKEVLKNK